MHYLALTMALISSSAHAVKCEGELFAWTYRKLINHSGLVRFLVLNPRAVVLALELGVPLRYIDHPFRLDGIYQFTGRLAVAMNRGARTPFRMLKRRARGRPAVLAYIAELEARAKTLGVESEWVAPGNRDHGGRSYDRIYLNAALFVQHFSLSIGLYILTHELNHETPRIAPRPGESLTSFTERFVADRLREELRVRRLDRQTRRRLREVGLPFPESLVPRLTLALWKADDAGAPETAVLGLLRPTNEPSLRERARIAYSR